MNRTKLLVLSLVVSLLACHAGAAPTTPKTPATPQKFGSVFPLGTNVYPRGVYNTAAPAPANGDSVNLQLDSAGNLRVSEQFASAAEDNVAGVLKVEQRYPFTNITTATTTVVKSGAGFLFGITFNVMVASATVTIYDNTAASGTKIGTPTLPSTITSAVPYTLVFNTPFSTGLTVVTSGATDITVLSR